MINQTQCEGVDDAEVRCQNPARYIDEFGQLMCGVCPIKYGADSLKPEQIGELITWAREVLDGGFMGGSSFARLRRIMGPKKPEPVIVAEPEHCIDSRCERGVHDPDEPHRARSWNAEWGTEEIEEW